MLSLVAMRDDRVADAEVVLKTGLCKQTWFVSDTLRKNTHTINAISYAYFG